MNFLRAIDSNVRSPYPEGDFTMRADERVREAERESKRVDALYKASGSRPNECSVGAPKKTRAR